MANTGVKGKLLTPGGLGLVGLWVVAFDVEVTDSDRFIAGAFSDSTGSYSITYSKWDFGVEHRPDLKICVFDYVGRLVYESVEFPDVNVDVFTAPDFTIPEKDCTGFLVTLLTGTPTMLSQDNLITPLIDNKVAWELITQKVMGATIFINTCQLYIDAGNVFTQFTQEAINSWSGQYEKGASLPSLTLPVSGFRIEEEMLKADKTKPVSVRVTVNDFMGGPAPMDTAGIVEDYFEDNEPNTVQYYRFQMPYNRAMHAKMFLVDGDIAILNASPILQEYYDDTTHKIDDPRRGRMSFPKNSIKVPVHDVSASIQGPAVEDLEGTFDIIFRQAGGVGPGIVPASPPDSVNAAIQITRTLPGNTFKSAPRAVPKGELGILESYLRAIAMAQEFIYFENQYLTEPRIVNALFATLAATPKLEVILLINNMVDIPRYQSLQTALLNRLHKDAEDQGFLNRIGIFTRWSFEPSPAAGKPARIIRNYVHSKVAIVDDKWATVGSANLDGVSLVGSQHILLYYSNADVIEERAVEVNAAIYNDVDGQPPSTVPKDLRVALWEEHLGVGFPETKPSTGWLDIWNTSADGKLAGLKATPPTSHPASILKWNSGKKAKTFLKNCGVSASRDLAIMEEINSFDFKTGKWE